jgi:hypothetical protein
MAATLCASSAVVAGRTSVRPVAGLRPLPAAFRCVRSNPKTL